MTKADLMSENIALKQELEVLKRRASNIILDDVTPHINIKYGAHRNQELHISTSRVWFVDSERVVIRFQSQDMLGLVGNAQNSFYIATEKKIKDTY